MFGGWEFCITYLLHSDWSLRWKLRRDVWPSDSVALRVETWVLGEHESNPAQQSSWAPTARSPPISSTGWGSLGILKSEEDRPKLVLFPSPSGQRLRGKINDFP